MITVDNIEKLLKHFPAEAGVYRDRIINGRIGGLKDVKAVVVHYTGVPNQTARGNAEYFGRVSGHPSDPYLSIHYAVDENEIWGCVPLDKRAGHCEDRGVGVCKKYYNNSNTIGIEVCPKHTSNKKYPAAQEKTWYFDEATVHNLAVLVAYLVRKVESVKGKRPEIVRHYDITGKWCPAPFLDYGGNDWEKFKKEVYLLLDGENTGETSMTDFWYCDGTVTVTYGGADGLNLRTAPRLNNNITSVLKKGDKRRAVQGIKMSDGTAWYRLEDGSYVSSNKAYVSYRDNKMQKFIGEVTGVPTKDTLNVRDFPNSNIGNVKKTLTNGNLLQVIGEAYNNGEHWYLVNQGDAKEKFSGFVAARYVK